MLQSLITGFLSRTRRVLSTSGSFKNVLIIFLTLLLLLVIMLTHYSAPTSLVSDSTTTVKPGAKGPLAEYGTKSGYTQHNNDFKVIGVSEERYANLKESSGTHPVPNVVIEQHPVQPQEGAAAGYTKEQTYIFHINDMASDPKYSALSSYTDESRLTSELSQNPVFRSFINHDLFDLIKESDPNITGGLNNDAHYKDGRRIPMLLGKLRENNVVDALRSKNYLSQFFTLSDEEKKILSDSHSNFVAKMPGDYPEEIRNSIKGDGILYCGGGKYNWLVLVSLKQLRSTGSKLPVEVFIPNDDEYSYDLCHRVFPTFGAKCITMSDFLDSEFELKGYQLKSMALLLTSFENVLMLDADNFPLKNPDYMFFNEPFTSHNLVIWPDIWRRSTSPTYYEIAGVKVNETHQVRRSYYDHRDHPDGMANFTKEDYNDKISYHDLEGTFPEASSETGQVLINKKTHAKSIFLGLFYNYYGPGYFYPMFSQGQAGEGDKETILASAHYFNLPYYQVEEYIREFGFLVRGSEEANFEEADFHILAMAQYDPILDFIQSEDYERFQSGFPYDSKKNNYYRHKFKHSEVMFLHTNIPKLYPWNLLGEGHFNVHHPDGKPRRLYSKVLINELGYDAELRVWDTMRWIICQHSDFRIPDLSQAKMKEICPQMEKHVNWLRSDIKNTILDEETLGKVDHKHMKPTDW